MLVVLALHYLTAPGVQALPISLIEQRAPSSCNDLHSCRTIWNIIWSCVFTIFSCTWVSVHPNIPAPEESWDKLALLRFKITLMALIAPELVILWAVRQWIMARKLAKEHQKYGWTMAHGFFAVMGGFMLFEDDKPPRTLKPTELKPYLESGAISITDEEIQDKSRGDVFSKGLVLLQTGWFVLQCIARRAQHLPLTELELITLAFATLSFVVYGLWWKKPLSVQRPYPVSREPATLHRVDVEGDWNDEYRVKGILKDMATDVGSSMAEIVYAVATIIRRTPGAMYRGMIQTMHTIWNAIRHALYHFRDNGVWGTIMAVTWAIFKHSLLPFGYMAWGEDGGVEHGARKVPTFYSGEQTGSEKMLAGFSGAAIATVFGAIHCVAWSFEFPTRTEQLLWRIASIGITCIPPLISALFGFQNYVPGWLGVIIAIFLGPIFYIVFRMILLVLALISLRSLPSDAYREINWANFIPHV